MFGSSDNSGALTASQLEAIRLQDLQTSVLGDLNHDSSLDAADAGILFSQWGETPLATGDLNRDQLVDAADAEILFAHWTGDAVALPEPMGLSCGMTLIAFVLRSRLSAVGSYPEPQ